MAPRAAVGFLELRTLPYRQVGPFILALAVSDPKSNAVPRAFVKDCLLKSPGRGVVHWGLLAEVYRPKST